MALKKDRKNTKKGVDKGLAVWYISKALDTRGRRSKAAGQNFLRERKKGLTNLGASGRIQKFAARLG